MTTFLQTSTLSKSFGGVMAVRDVDLAIGQGEIVGMIGPNGSGKSTFVNLLTGIYKPDQGQVHFNGRRLNNLPVHTITAAGIARTFQNLRVFQNISALENVLIGRHCRVPISLIDIYCRPWIAWRQERRAQQRALEFLEKAHLADRKNHLAKNFPYGEQRLLEICRALASDPQLLLLDEPCAGMNPVEMDALAQFVRNLRDGGITIFIIEHNMRFIMAVAERIVVMNAGRKFREGLPAQIQQDEEVQKIYLGEEDDS